MDRERLDGWCERGILSLVLAILVFSALAVGAVRLQEFLIVEWLTVCILFLWLCRFWLNPKHRLLWPPVCWPVVLFMAYAVGRYLTADIEEAARQEMIKVLIYGFLFLSVLHNLHRQETTQNVGMTVIGLGMVISLYALIQFLTSSNSVWLIARPEDYLKRGSGTFYSPSHLAGYLAMLLPLGLNYTLTGRFSYLNKILLGYASLMIFTGIVVTVSLGGWMAVGISLAVLFVWLMRQRDYRLQSLLLLSGMVAIAVALLLSAELSANRKERLSAMLQTEDIRFDRWAPATKVWTDHFWLGDGPGHFAHRFGQQHSDNPDGQWSSVHAHNDYLDTLADWGLIGALLIASAWAIFYWEVFRSWKYVKRSPDDFAAKRSNKSSFVMGGALGLLAMLLHSVVDFDMHIPAIAILAVTLMALVSGHFRFATEQYWHTVRGPMRLVVSVCLLAGLVYLGWQCWRQTFESVRVTTARQSENGSPGQV